MPDSDHTSPEQIRRDHEQALRDQENEALESQRRFRERLAQEQQVNVPDLADAKARERTLSQDKDQNLHLSHKDAWAGSPDDVASCGEEDIGVGLETLVADEHTATDGDL